MIGLVGKPGMVKNAIKEMGKKIEDEDGRKKVST
jgi:hypothetical protein